jgi:hypothetical protein
MAWLIWGAILPACLLGLLMVLGRWVTPRASASHSFDHAREQFRYEREWLEARFLTAMADVDPVLRLRWEHAHWQDDVVWARDRLSGCLLALVGVRFDINPFDDETDLTAAPRRTTVVFHYRRGRWQTDAACLEATEPHEALLRDRRFEPVSSPRARRV